MGGDTLLHSRVGVGSTFTVVLPHRWQTRVSEYELDNIHVPLTLVIEDYPATSKLLCDWLSEAGVATLQAFDGTSGIEMAKRFRPHLVVLDLRLPDIDGWEVLAAIRREPDLVDVAVVVVTISEEVDEKHAAQVQDFFVKPVDRVEFIRRVHELMPGPGAPPPAGEILLVEADAHERDRVVALLTEMGLRVREAASRDAALDYLTRHLCKLVVIDVGADGMDGFGLIDSIRHRPECRTVPIMVASRTPLSLGDRQRIQGAVQSIVRLDGGEEEKLRNQLAILGLVESPSRAG